MGINDLIIRRLKSTEYETYKDIRLKSLKQNPEAFASRYEDALSRNQISWINQANDLATSQDCCALIVLVNQIPIGLCGLYRSKDEIKSGELVQVWLDPLFRGSGISNKLIHEMMLWAKSVGINEIEAVVHVDNSRAMKFYKKIGFSKIETEGRDAKLIIEI